MQLSSKVAKDPGVLCEYADALGMVQGRRLAAKPAEPVAQALALDPKYQVALEMTGSEAATATIRACWTSFDDDFRYRTVAIIALFLEKAHLSRS